MSNMQSKKEMPYGLFRFIQILLLLIGIITITLGTDKIQNYDEPYKFGLIFGGIGVVLGVIIALKVRPYTFEQNNYYTPFITFLVFFFGVFLYTGSLVNEKLSIIEKSDYYEVVNKYRKKSGYRTPEVNSIIIKENGFPNRLICSYRYWEKRYIGEKINVNRFSSKMGFDYVVIPEDK